MFILYEMRIIGFLVSKDELFKVYGYFLLFLFVCFVDF